MIRRCGIDTYIIYTTIMEQLESMLEPFSEMLTGNPNHLRLWFELKETTFDLHHQLLFPSGTAESQPSW